MKPTTELFDLIKSLSRSEKRYFTLGASVQKGNKNYLKLFNAIDSQKSYDEEVIKKKYSKERFVSNLTFTKNYLYRLIFRSLNSYYNERSIDTKMNNLLNKCRLLYGKALFSQYFKSVQTGKEMAAKYEMFSYMLEFLELERQLTRKEEVGKKSMDDIYDEEIKIIEEIRIINSYKRAISKLFRINWLNGTVRSSKEDEHIDQVLSEELFGRKKLPSTLIARERYYFALYLGHELKGNAGTSYEYNKKRSSLISVNKNVFQKFIFDNYEESSLTLISSAAFAGKFNEAKKLFEKYDKLFSKKGSVDLDIMITYYSYNLLRMIHQSSNLFDEGMLTRFEKFLLNYKGKLNIDTYNYAFYNIARYFFIKENYEEALRVINILFESRLLKHTPRIEPYTRLLNILIHFEIGNKKLLSHLISATAKYLKNKNKLFKTEKAVLHYLKKIIAKNDSENELKNFTALRKELQVIMKDKYERNIIIYFNYPEWLAKKTKLKLNHNERTLVIEK
ncbi:MAG: hypothetical protein ABI462_03200 [Ignavibacteria bacterium]